MPEPTDEMACSAWDEVVDGLPEVTAKTPISGVASSKVSDPGGRLHVEQRPDPTLHVHEFVTC